MWGIGADLDLWAAKTLNQSLKYSGAVPASGTFVFSSKEGPRGFAVIGPRIGYAGDIWLPYVRVGTIIALGSHDSTLFYTSDGRDETYGVIRRGHGFFNRRMGRGRRWRLVSNWP